MKGTMWRPQTRSPSPGKPRPRRQLILKQLPARNNARRMRKRRRACMRDSGRSARLAEISKSSKKRKLSSGTCPLRSSVMPPTSRIHMPRLIAVAFKMKDRHRTNTHLPPHITSRVLLAKSPDDPCTLRVPRPGLIATGVAQRRATVVDRVAALPDCVQ